MTDTPPRRLNELITAAFLEYARDTIERAPNGRQTRAALADVAENLVDHLEAEIVQDHSRGRRRAGKAKLRIWLRLSTVRVEILAIPLRDIDGVDAKDTERMLRAQFAENWPDTVPESLT